MHPIESQIAARTVAIDRLNGLTTWITLCALAALAVFTVIAAATIPGKADSGQTAGTNGSAAAADSSTLPTNTSFNRHHHQDSGGITSSSGAPVAVTGGSH